MLHVASRWVSWIIMDFIDLQVEFGKPSALLENEKGMLRALVDESGDREKLYAAAMGASAS